MFCVLLLLGLSKGNARVEISASFLCGLHEVYSHIMVSPDLVIYLFIYLFIYVFIYLFVYESRASVTWSSVVVLVVSLGSSSSS